MACSELSSAAIGAACADRPRARDIEGADWSLEMARPQLSRSAAALAMSATGGLGAAAIMFAVPGFAVEALAAVVGMAAAAAGFTGAFVMRWFASHTRFGWGAAAFGGVVTAFLSFTPFTLILIVSIAIEQWRIGDWFEPDLVGLAQVYVAAAVVAPFALSPIIAPIGALGGLACRALTPRR